MQTLTKLRWRRKAELEQALKCHGQVTEASVHASIILYSFVVVVMEV